MEVTTAVLEPPEPREKKLVIEWPEKSVLFENRDKYVADNLFKMKQRIVESNLIIEEGFELNELAKIVLGAD